jgi:hypothetical protein
MNDYAPLYSKEEKIKKIVLYSLWLIPIGVLYFGVIPWFKSTNWFLCHPQGYEIFYKGLYLGFSILFLLIQLYELPQNLKIIRLKQYPLPEQKTWSLQAYAYGAKATWRSYMSIGGTILLIGLIIYVIPLTNKVVNEIDQNKLAQERALQCQNP